MPSLFSSSVRKSELVSTRSGVRSSEPTAMISLSSVQLSGQWQAAHVPIEREEGVGGGENRAARWLERHTHNAGAAEHDIGLSLRRDPHDAAAPGVRGRHIEISVAIQSQALRPPEATEENAYIAALRDFVDAVKAGRRRSRNVQIAAGMKR